jgi:anti-anti-sigma regulatory factor
MSDDRFRITHDPAENSAALTVLSPTLDMAAGGAFETRCRQLLRSPRTSLTVDLSRVKHVPSTVVSAIVSLDTAARLQGRTVRVRCGRLVARMLEQLVPTPVEATD